MKKREKGLRTRRACIATNPMIHERIGQFYQIGNHGEARFTALGLNQDIVTGNIISKGGAFIRFF
jgi:hypothetical protein